MYEHAFGEARTGTPATPGMRYAIGSVSKQFTAAAVLLLAEDGRLSLDDPVSRWFPDLTRSSEITLRHLLSMTSGYQDYWPQDYVYTAMRSPTVARSIATAWAGKPVDFDPGAQWQYSNTNYVIAGAIVSQVAGMPFMKFLERRIFTPLGMKVADFDAGPLPAADAGAWLRHGLGPLRPAPKEAAGWLFAAGQLAMTARDLATWNIAMIDRTAMAARSYRELQTATPLASGIANRLRPGHQRRTRRRSAPTVPRWGGVWLHHHECRLSRRPCGDYRVHQHLPWWRRRVGTDREPDRCDHPAAHRQHRHRRPRDCPAGLRCSSCMAGWTVTR